MNPMEIIREYVLRCIDQGLINQNNLRNPLPDDQQQELDKMLKAIHDLVETERKIKPQYWEQIRNTCLLKLAIEMGWINNPNGGIK